MYLVHTIKVYQPNTGSMLGSQPIAGSMPANRIRRWPNIDTELGDCPVFALTAIRVRDAFPPESHYPDNTIHRLNCETLLGHRLRRLASIIPIKTL